MFQRQGKAEERADAEDGCRLAAFVWAQGEEFCDCHPGPGGVLEVGWGAAQKEECRDMITFWEAVRMASLFLYHRKVRPMIQKRSARIATRCGLVH